MRDVANDAQIRMAKGGLIRPTHGFSQRSTATCTRTIASSRRTNSTRLIRRVTKRIRPSITQILPPYTDAAGGKEHRVQPVRVGPRHYVSEKSRVRRKQ